MADGIASNPNERANPWTPTGTEQTGRYSPPAGTAGAIWSSIPGQLLKYENAAYQNKANEDLNRAIMDCLPELKQLQTSAPTRGLTLIATFADVQVGEAKQVILISLSYGLVGGPIVGIWDNNDNPMARSAGRSTPAAGSDSKFNYGPSRIRSHTYLVPPLNAGVADKVEPGWISYYRIVGSKLSTGDIEGAVRTLNGCNMYDMLRILYRFALEGQDYNLLSGVYQTVGGVGTLRLKAAFAAVKARLGGANNWSGFSLSFQEYSQLAPFEQRDIDAFLGRSNADEDKDGEERNLLGRWTVKCGPWTWLYHFNSDHTVTWLDQGNGKNGRGKWKLGDLLKTTWHPSPTYENWRRPVTEDKMEGVAYMKEGRFNLYASRPSG